MKRMSGLFSLAMAMAVTLPAQAQFAKPEDAVKYRKASFTVMSAHFGRLGAMANGRVPYDAKAAAEIADVALTLAAVSIAVLAVRGVAMNEPVSGASSPGDELPADQPPYSDL